MINYWLENPNIFPDLLWAIGMALLTILIPLAIAILGDILQKRKNKELDFVELDLHVILDNVLQFKELLILMALIFVPSFMWRNTLGKVIILIYWLIGIFGVVEIIIHIYKWVKGNEYEFRFSYLKDLRNIEDLKSVWPSIWKVQKMDDQSEKQFFDVFSTAVERLFKKDKGFLPLAMKLLNNFYSYINNRSIVLLAVSDDCLKIMQWHFNMWQRKNEYKDQKIRERTNAYIILRKLTSIVQSIEERALREEESWSFFENLKRHMEIYGKKERTIKNGRVEYYAEYLLKVVYFIFFKVMENIEDFSKRYDIWECFPNKWKVTKNNYQSCLESRISLDYFLKWAQARIQYAEKDRNDFLDETIENLFPEVDPITWSRILLFIYHPYTSNSEIRSVIEKKWHFGHISRIYSGMGVRDGDIQKELEGKIESDIKSTYELAFFLFEKIFTKENLEKYVEELKKLELTYNKDSMEEKHRVSLLNIFIGMLNYYNNQINE